MHIYCCNHRQPLVSCTPQSFTCNLWTAHWQVIILNDVYSLISKAPLIDTAVTSEINTKQLYMCTTESSNRCSSSNTIVPFFEVLKTCTYTVAGLIALPSTHSSSSQSWLVGIKATTSGFVANSLNFSSVLIPQCLSPPAQTWISPSWRLSVEIRHYWL